MSQKIGAYTRFLDLVQALRALPSFVTMDATEERLLNQLAVLWNAGRQVPVLEAMKMSPDASPTTVHRRLKTLRQKGMIDLLTDETDNRIRYIVPTANTERYFSEMGACMSKAVDGVAA
jgi:predicted transcriptional regulator